MSNQWQPNINAIIAYADANIQVYTDGTWVPLAKGNWALPDDYVIYANGTGDARSVTAWGHRKQSHCIAPDGTAYQVRTLALLKPGA